MMDKLFDGSDAHLLPGNVELIQRPNEPELHYPGNFDTVKRANAILMCLCQEAADALESADKRIAELEAELQKRAKQIGVACMTHDLTHSLACGRCLTEAERKLAVAREAMCSTYKILLQETRAVVALEVAEIRLRKALAQIGGDDE